MDNSQVIFNQNETKDREEKKEALAPAMAGLVRRYQEIISAAEAEGEISRIHVDEIASKIALLYEKVRKIIDWKDENLIRRAAIERILKRRLIIKISGFGQTIELKGKKIAEPLVLELIRGGHFPNNTIPRKKIAEVERCLDKYIYILNHNPVTKNRASPKIKKGINLYNWILEIAACEIEEILDPALKEKALINFMTRVMKERVQVAPELKITEEEKVVQIYIAVHHALFHLDASIIAYHLIKLRFPDWKELSQEKIEKVAQRILAIWQQIENDLNHPLSSEFHKICEKYDTVYLIIGDILEELSKTPSEISQKMSDSKSLNELIKRAYDRRLKTLRSRLYRAAVYSTLSIFVAGGLSLFIIEFPLAKLFYGRFSPLAITADILIPTIVMFALVSAIRLPKGENFNRVVKEVNSIVFPQKEKEIYDVRPRKKRGFISTALISLLYASISLASLWFVFWLFWIAKVPVTSLFIDTLNIAMIIFAAIIIRQRAKEMTIEEKTTFWEFFIDMLSVPIGKLGQWLSNKWREYNIVSVFFTALIDLPFSGFVEFVENWSSFLKEKKAEIQQ